MKKSLDSIEIPGPPTLPSMKIKEGFLTDDLMKTIKKAATFSELSWDEDLLLQLINNNLIAFAVEFREKFANLSPEAKTLLNLYTYLYLNKQKILLTIAQNQKNEI